MFYLLKRKAYSPAASHTWQQISKNLPFDQFLLNMKQQQLPFLDTLYQNEISEDEIIRLAGQFCNNCFDILGSGLHCFSQIPWHRDWSCKSKNIYTEFNSKLFYKDIKPSYGHNHIEKDIKVPWELSRFHQGLILGKAYELTQDQKYTHAFVNQITNWIQNNPYLFGVNWACPMEVAIRAINWIVAWHFFKKSSIISSHFWQQFTGSLFNHLEYLEHNWEIYDGRTGNHYLSNLVGYFYLCWFFQQLPGITKKIKWCFAKIEQEAEKQIFNEGTDYEGSTTYHRLVTELFYHFYLLCNEFKKEPSDQFKDKLNCMFSFISWCTPTNGSLITIGDNDSGKLLYYGLPKRLTSQNNQGITHFKDFGLSILKSNNWHISLRHYSYEHKQPTGHFHNDAGSITLSVNGIPIFCDPGSYVYTPSTAWRNRFRSVAFHNTFSIKNHEPIPFNEHIFSLNLPESKPFVNFEKSNTLSMIHSLYQRFNLRANRNIQLQDKVMIISDSWSGKNTTGLVTCWNFTLSPEITVTKQGTGFLFFHEHIKIGLFQTNVLKFTIQDAWVSPAYGKKVKSKRLYAQVPLMVDKKYIISFQAITHV